MKDMQEFKRVDTVVKVGEDTCGIMRGIFLPALLNQVLPTTDWAARATMAADTNWNLILETQVVLMIIVEYRNNQQ